MSIITTLLCCTPSLVLYFYKIFVHGNIETKFL